MATGFRERPGSIVTVYGGMRLRMTHEKAEHFISLAIRLF